ncbi:MAG TPA: hypothetical protein VGH94_04075 [Acidimicrobiales bacterium]|jgi:hypothetical protein
MSQGPLTELELQSGATSGRASATPGLSDGPHPRRHRTRVMGGQGGGRGWWQAWCTEPGCSWRGSTLPQRVGSRQQATVEAEGHEEATGGYVD